MKSYDFGSAWKLLIFKSIESTPKQILTLQCTLYTDDGNINILQNINVFIINNIIDLVSIEGTTFINIIYNLNYI